MTLSMIIIIIKKMKNTSRSASLRYFCLISQSLAVPFVLAGAVGDAGVGVIVTLITLIALRRRRGPALESCLLLPLLRLVLLSFVP